MKSRILISALVFSAMALPALARDRIQIVGSSTVFPFSTMVGDVLLRTSFNAPIIESTGTGGGAKLFCRSMDLNILM